MTGRLAVLCSGQGSILKAVAAAIAAGELNAELALVVADRQCPAADWSAGQGIATVVVDRTGTPWEEREVQIEAALLSHQISHLLLAGYLSRLGSGLVHRYAERALNVHPSLLPAFPGLDAIGQALAHGVRVSGVTVHVVSEDVDGGPIVWQEAVPVWPDDDWHALRQRLAPLEQRGVLTALGWMLGERLTVRGRTVVVATKEEV
ncbi:MAG: phosphoribosylglycinamide formyltransferase [Sulfobacillus sp.]